MTEQFQRIDTPEWLAKLFKSIDDLNFSAESGFHILSDDIVMQFGQDTVKGIDDAKKFFTKLDEPYDTEHFVHEVFQLDKTIIMHGSAKLSPKGDPSTVISAAPLLNILWLDDNGKVVKYVVDYPPEIEAMK